MHDSGGSAAFRPVPGANAIFVAAGTPASALLHPNFHLPSTVPPTLPPPTAPPIARASTIIAWSGSLASHDDPQAELFEPNIGTWTKPGWSALAKACERLVPLLVAHDLHLWIRPHPAHIISDGPSMLKFLREVVPAASAHNPHAASPRLAVLPDPAMLLTPAMLPLAEDHLDRLFAYVDAVLATSNTGLVVSSVALSLPIPNPPASQTLPLGTPHAGPGQYLRPCPPDQAVISPAQLTRRIESLVNKPARLFSSSTAD